MKRNTALATTKSLSQSQSGMNNITTLTNNNNNLKRKKIGMLNLDLGEIIE